jgi:hypothetical protein
MRSVHALGAAALFLALTSFHAPLGHAQEANIQIVVAADSEIDAITLEEATQLFLGRRTSLENGIRVTLVDLPSGPVRNQLYQTLTGKNPVQVKAYWSRLVFSGRIRPPFEAVNQEEARAWLLTHANAIGYLPATVSDSRLKVLLTLP